MPRRASKKEDPIEAARRVVDEAIGERPKTVDPAVSAAAAALSKLGASKGGEARAKSLTAAERSEIAKNAAAARWRK
jgi:hypothetical protein